MAGAAADGKPRPSLLSADEVFEAADHFAVAAVHQPVLEPIHRHYHQLAQGLESPGWKKGSPMSQTQKLLSQMRAGRSVTRLTAMHSGVMNLTARIADLRNQGHNIVCTWKKDMEGREYGEFSLKA